VRGIALVVLASACSSKPAPSVRPPVAVAADAGAPADAAVVAQVSPADAAIDGPPDAASPAIAQTGEWPQKVPACKVKSTGTPIDLARAPEQLHARTVVAPASRAYSFSADGKEVEYYDAKSDERFAVSITGGPARKMIMAREDAMRPFAEAMRRAGRPGSPLLVLSPTLAIGSAKQRGQTSTVEVSLTDVRQLAPDGLDLAMPEAIDDHQVGFAGGDHHLWIADLATRDLRCMTTKPPARFEPLYQFAHTRDFLAYTLDDVKAKRHEVHVVDLARGTDARVATSASDQLLVHAVPGKPTFVIVAGGTSMRLYTLDAATGAIARIAPALRGWANVWIAPDGASFLVSQGEIPLGPNWRPPQPRTNPRPPDARPCDPVACHGCGWQSNGCWDVLWCGECPGSRPPDPVPLPDDGLYVIAL
jgi:hypothetical protein